MYDSSGGLLTFVHLPAFTRAFRRLRLTDDDLRGMEQAVLDDPAAGDVMAGTGGLRKLRYAPRWRRTGKSGGVRVCYIAFVAHGRVYFVTVYAKGEKSNLTPAERNAARQLVEEIGRELNQESR